MNNPSRTLSDLHNEFRQKSRQLYFGQKSNEKTREIIGDRQKIVSDIRKIKLSQWMEKPDNIRLAGSRNENLINQLSSKGIVVRQIKG